MPRRTQVTYNPPTPDLQPVAAPQSRPFAPRLAPEVLLPVKELAGLSETLSRISVQQAEEDAKVKRKEGLDAAAAAGPDVLEALRQAGSDQDTAEGKQKANQQAFTDLVKAGKIHVSQDPWAHVGFVQGMSHRLMAGYDAKLNARLAETTATQDANGNPVLAKDPDAVAQEVWSEYKDNPFFANYYGGQIAQQMKGESDAKFASNSARVLGENRVKDTVTWYQNTLTDKLFGQAVSGQAPTEDTWAQIKATGDELYQKTGGLVDRRAALMDAVKGTASRLDAGDTGAGKNLSGVSKAAAFLREMRDAPSGSTTLGKDATSSPELEAMIAQYDRDYKSKSENLGRDERNEDARAIQTGLRKYHAALDKARESGGGTVDVQAVMADVSRQFHDSNEFADRTGLVVDALQGAAIETNQKQGALSAGRMAQDLVNGGNPDAIAQEATVLYGSGGMDRPAYEAVVKAAADRKSIKHLIESSPISVNAHQTLERAAQIPGIPGEYEGEIGVQAQADQRQYLADYNRREVNAMTQINALPVEQQEDAMRKWHEENDEDAAKTLREAGLKLSADRADAISQIHNLVMQSQDPGELINKYRPLLAEKEVENFQIAAAARGDVEQMMRGDEYKDAEQFADDTVSKVYEKNEHLRDIQETVRRELRRSFAPIIRGKLVGTDPADRGAIIRTTAEELVDSVVQRVANSRIVRLTEAAKPGEEGVPSANEVLDAGEANRALAVQVSKENPEEAAKSLRPANANVPQSVVDYQDAFLSGSRPASQLFQKVRLKDLQNKMDVEGRGLIENAKLDDKDKAQAFADMHSVTGIPAQDLLDGKLRVRSSPDWRARAEGTLTRLEGIDDPRFEPQRRLLREQLAKAPNEFDLQGVKVGVFTTPMFTTEAELNFWVNHREADLRKIGEKYGMLPSGPANRDKPFKDLINHQIAAIRRLNQEQR